MFGFFHRNATSGITIGTVVTGETASAEITPDGKLNLVLPALSEQAEQRLTAAEAAIAAAQSLASTADTKADAAASAAAQAQSDVAAAKQEVTTDMNNQLNPIRTKLNTVSNSVQAAQRTADTAQAAASKAQGDINTVTQNVATAQATANAAQTAAEEAALTALKTGLELVWENPDQNQPMGETTESPVYIGGANDDAYEAIMVEVLLRKCVPGVFYDYIVASPFVLKGHEYLLRVPNGTILNDKEYAGYSYRSITFNEDGKHFSVSEGAVELAGTKDDGGNNDVLIPVRVYGIRQINSNLPTT